MLRLALHRRFLTRADVASSYDRLAARYDDNWLCRIRPATDRLLVRLPDLPADAVVADLGCGTGYATRALASRFPNSSITAIDLSGGMLEEARRRLQGARCTFLHAEMLDGMRQLGPATHDLIVSAWAMGYSDSAAVIREAARMLRRGGRFAFIGNLADTLSAVRLAFRRTMQAHHQSLHCLALPHFPESGAALRAAALKAGLAVEWMEEGHQTVCRHDALPQPALPWMLNTGVLAGFEAMLPLDGDGPVAECFERELRATGEDLRHHFAAGMLLKS